MIFSRQYNLKKKRKKGSELLLKCIKMLGFQAAAPNPAGGANAHPRPLAYPLTASCLQEQKLNLARLRLAQ